MFFCTFICFYAYKNHFFSVPFDDPGKYLFLKCGTRLYNLIAASFLLSKNIRSFLADSLVYLSQTKMTPKVCKQKHKTLRLNGRIWNG